MARIVSLESSRSPAFNLVSRVSLASAVGAALLLSVTAARADEPASAPMSAGAPAPAKVVAAPTLTCALGAHVGVDDADASTIREIVARDLAIHHAPPGHYEVRVSKLGGRLLFVVEHHTEQGIEDRRALVAGVEEVPIASPRLVDALVSGKPLEETQNVTNVLAVEARPAVMKQGHPGFAGGIVGVTPAGVPTGFGGGAELGMVYEAERYAVTIHGRLAGNSQGDANFMYFNLGAGARYFLTDGDIAPYVGGGTGFSAYGAKVSGTDFSGNGMNLYGEVGIEAFRTNRAAFLVGLRADAPLFSMTGTTVTYGTPSSSSGYNYSAPTTTTSNRYGAPISLNVGIVLK